MGTLTARRDGDLIVIRLENSAEDYAEASMTEEQAVRFVTTILREVNR
jgi:hypothetical protein